MDVDINIRVNVHVDGNVDAGVHVDVIVNANLTANASADEDGDKDEDAGVDDGEDADEDRSGSGTRNGPEYADGDVQGGRLALGPFRLSKLGMLPPPFGPLFGWPWAPLGGPGDPNFDVGARFRAPFLV